MADASATAIHGPKRQVRIPVLTRQTGTDPLAMLKLKRREEGESNTLKRTRDSDNGECEQPARPAPLSCIDALLGDDPLRQVLERLDPADGRTAATVSRRCHGDHGIVVGV